jgi:hypothetical protein
MINKCMMVLQSYTNLGKILVGPYGETYPACYDADHAMNMKDEEDISPKKEEEDPVPITMQEIKIEPEVSCMSLSLSLYVHC